MKKCKCFKGGCKCGCKRKHKTKLHIIPILALITCFQLIAPKAVKESVPGKALKYSLTFAWGGIALFGILKIVGFAKKTKKKIKKK